MNSRQRKKYVYVKSECAHNKSCDEDVPYCDYYISRTLFRCARQPQFTNHFNDELEKCYLDICEKCKSFTLSRETMRLGRERRKMGKWMNRHYYKIANI